MVRHFLRYWISRDGNWSVLDNPLMTYSASNQYDRVEPGDVIWAVIRDPSTLHLILVGRMTVDWIGSKSEASTKLGMPEEDMWDADIYVTCNEPEAYDYIDINDYAGKLRFISNTNDRLNLVDGLVDPTQLQTMRELTSESVSMLRAIWYDINQTISDPDKTFSEGQRKLRIHVQRERNQSLIATAKRRFKQEHGRLFCEVCCFDFTQAYGELGDDFIEAHHRVPLSEIDDEQVTQTTSDLAMVCANCHRMLHREKPWLSVDELRSLIRSDYC